jgi:hypothetical protein
LREQQTVAYSTMLSDVAKDETSLADCAHVANTSGTGISDVDFNRTQTTGPRIVEQLRADLASGTILGPSQTGEDAKTLASTVESYGSSCTTIVTIRYQNPKANVRTAMQELITAASKVQGLIGTFTC